MNGSQSGTQGVYTIISRDIVKEALANGGEGEFRERKNWAAAAKYFATSDLNDKPYPLLLGDAANIVGVEWGASIEGIERVENGTRVRFSRLFELRKAIPLNKLIKASDGLPLAREYRRPYVPCLIQNTFEQDVLAQLAGDVANEKNVSLKADFQLRAVLQELDADPKCHRIPATVRKALIEARIGQGRYRIGLLRVWGSKCALTGCDLKQVLVASHVKPWAQCTNEERLDEFNGLLLAAHIDKLFDCGLISFADDGRLLVKSEINTSMLVALGIAKCRKLRFVSNRHLPYLKVHRRMYGFDQ